MGCVWLVTGEGSHSWPPSLSSPLALIFQLRFCLFFLFIRLYTWNWAGQGGPLFSTWDAGRWERPGVEWSVCLCVNCCCAGWFPHAPHTWSGGGRIQACSQRSHTDFSPCRDPRENTDKPEKQTRKTRPRVSSLFCSCVRVRTVCRSSVSRRSICQVFRNRNEEFKHLERIERPSQIHSFLHGVERRHFLKISSLRTSAHIVYRWCSCSPTFVRTDVCQCFSIFISLQPAVLCEFEVRHAVFYVFKTRDTFPINPGASCLRGRDLSATPARELHQSQIQNMTFCPSLPISVCVT